MFNVSCFPQLAVVVNRHMWCAVKRCYFVVNCIHACLCDCFNCDLIDICVINWEQAVYRRLHLYALSSLKPFSYLLVCERYF